MKKTIAPVFACLLWSACASSQATMYVIANDESPESSLSRNTTIDLFMGRARAFSNGTRATPFDLPTNSSQRHSFYKRLVGFSPAQLNSYWSRLTFSGRTLPPYQLQTEDQIVEMVCKNPSAIAYVSNKPTTECVKVLIEVDAK